MGRIEAANKKILSSKTREVECGDKERRRKKESNEVVARKVGSKYGYIWLFKSDFPLRRSSRIHVA